MDRPDVTAPEMATRLTAILDRIRRLRASLYPPDYDMDPLYRLEQDIASLLADLQNPD